MKIKIKLPKRKTLRAVIRLFYRDDPDSVIRMIEGSEAPCSACAYSQRNCGGEDCADGIWKWIYEEE